MHVQDILIILQLISVMMQVVLLSYHRHAKTERSDTNQTVHLLLAEIKRILANLHG